MIALTGGLLLVTYGLVWLGFRRRINQNLPEIEHPTRRDMHIAAPGAVTAVGVLALFLGLTLIVIYLLWFR